MAVRGWVGAARGRPRPGFDAGRDIGPPVGDPPSRVINHPFCGRPVTAIEIPRHTVHPMKPIRRSMRLPEFGYGGGWAYHVVICTANRKPRLASLDGTASVPSPLGRIVQEQLAAVPSWWVGVTVEEVAIMPDHLHLLIRLEPGSSVVLPRVVNRIKGRCTIEARNRGLLCLDERLWQRNYYEHIIRNRHHLDRARRYIRANPLRWARR